MKLEFPNGEHPDVGIGDRTVNIGSRAENDVTLAADGIQPLHAQLVPDAGRLIVVPEGAAQISVNGRNVAARTPVQPGDVVGLREVEVRVVSDAHSPQAAPQPEAEEPDDGTIVRPMAVAFRLRNVSGNELGHSFSILSRTVVGRDASCDIRLQSEEVSRRHAVLQASASEVRVTDLESANGTFVNGEALVPHQPRVVHAGDEIAFDQTRFLLESTGAANPDAVEQPSGDATSSTRRARKLLGALVVVVIVLVLAWWFTR